MATRPISERASTAGAGAAETTPDHAPPFAALQWLDARLADAVDEFRQRYAREAAGEPFRGLFIDDAELERLMALAPGTSPLQPSCALQPPLDAWPEMAAIRDRYGLDDFAVSALLIAAAPALDLRYERIYSFLQDDVTKKRPTVDLILNLLTHSAAEKLAQRTQFREPSALLRHHLIELIGETSSASLLASFVQIDPRIVDQMLGHSLPDVRLARYCTLTRPSWTLCDAQSRPAPLAAVQRLVESIDPEARPRAVIQLCGTPGSGRFETLQSVARSLFRPVLTVTWQRVVAAGEDTNPALGHRVLREAERTGALLHVEIEDIDAAREALDALLLTLGDYPGPLCITTPGVLPYRPHGPVGEQLVLHPIAFTHDDAGMRDAVLEAMLARHRLALSVAERRRFTDRFVLSTHQIATVVQQAAGDPALLHAHADAPTALAYADLARHAKAQGRDRLRDLAVRIVPKYRWHDLVLPADTERQLHELLGRIQHRRTVLHELGFADKLSLGQGTAALLVGPSGVGKTMAAEVLAQQVGLELFKADLSTLVSKYIGETAKNLSTLFDAAAAANCILFLDEADAVCGKRGSVHDAQDRYANVEIAYLLQKIEEYDGIVLLATNLPQNFDEAFSRRITSKVFFPFPDAPHRERIWQSVWPRGVDRAGDIDWAGWAQAFELSGGNIKNIALAATYLAAAEGTPVTHALLLRGLQREYQKLGRWTTLDELRRQFEARR